MNYCPLGSGALAGTTYPLDRAYTAELLEFDGPTLNSMDSVADRDYLIELLAALSTISMHLSRFCEEIIIWNTNEYRFVEIDDSYSTGSSIMPQKKNPDIAELIRGKSGRVYGALVSLLTTMKGLPLAYNKDMQEDKELSFDAIDTVKGCLALFTGMISTMTFRRDVMEESARGDLPTPRMQRIIWSIMEYPSGMRMELWDSWCWPALNGESVWMSLRWRNIRKSVRYLRKISTRRSVWRPVWRNGPPLGLRAVRQWSR